MLGAVVALNIVAVSVISFLIYQERLKRQSQENISSVLAAGALSHKKRLEQHAIEQNNRLATQQVNISEVNLKNDQLRSHIDTLLTENKAELTAQFAPLQSTVQAATNQVNALVKTIEKQNSPQETLVKDNAILQNLYPRNSTQGMQLMGGVDGPTLTLSSNKGTAQSIIHQGQRGDWHIRSAHPEGVVYLQHGTNGQVVIGGGAAGTGNNEATTFNRAGDRKNFIVGNTDVRGALTATEDVATNGSVYTKRVGARTADDLQLVVNNQPFVFIKPSGSVGVGVHDPKEMMHVAGNMRIDGDGVHLGNEGYVLTRDLNGTYLRDDRSFPIILRQNNNDRLTVTGEGNVDIANHLNVGQRIGALGVNVGTQSARGDLNIFGKLCLNGTCIEDLNVIMKTVQSPSSVGRTSENPARNASQIWAQSTSTTRPESGVYYYKPTGWNGPPVPLFTDFTTDGGAWVVISKWGGHSKTMDRVFNADFFDSGDKSLLNPDMPARNGFARVSRNFMNALWNESKYTVRIHFKNDDATNTSGIYFQKKVSNTAGFDLWRAHYSPVYWSDMMGNGVSAGTDNGARFKVAFARATINPDWVIYTSAGLNIYNPDTNDIVGGSGLNGNCGYWDRVTINAPGYGNLEIARHMGFFGDITTGNQWLFTCNPSDGRWNQNENRQSVIFLRC